MPLFFNLFKGKQYLILLHFTVFIWGFTGILGKLIDLPSDILVWYRTLIGTLAYVLFFLFFKVPFKYDFVKNIKIVCTGVILGFHWLLFFASIKASNVSIALAAIACLSFFTSFMEPLILRRKMYFHEPVLGLLVIVGAHIIFRSETNYTLGIILGLTAAFLASLFLTLNAKFIKQGHNALEISFYEIFGAFGGILIWLLISQTHGIEDFKMTVSDGVYLVVLGTICTSLAFWVGIYILKFIPPFTVSIVGNLEFLYSILLALLIFGEEEFMSIGFYIGAFVLTVVIFLNSYAKKRARKKELKRR